MWAGPAFGVTTGHLRQATLCGGTGSSLPWNPRWWIPISLTSLFPERDEILRSRVEARGGLTSTGKQGPLQYNQGQ